MRRFDPGFLEMKAALEAGACGTALVVHCVSRGVSSAPGSTSESSVTGSAIHELDTVPWLLEAPIVEVSWHAPRSASSSRPGSTRSPPAAPRPWPAPVTGWSPPPSPTR